MRDTRRALVSLKYKVRGVDRELARGCAPGPPARLQRSSPRLQVQPVDSTSEVPRKTKCNPLKQRLEAARCRDPVATQESYISTYDDAPNLDVGAPTPRLRYKV